MVTIIDKRNDRDLVVKSVKKFINRNKRIIAQAIDKILETSSITDLKSNTKKVVQIDRKTLHEPTYHFVSRSFFETIYVTGNNKYEVGDHVCNVKFDDSIEDNNEEGESDEDGENTGTGDELDSFSFILSKDDFMELLFNHCKLPNLTKIG